MTFETWDGRKLTVKDLTNESLIEHYYSLYRIALDTQKKSDWENLKEVKQEIINRMDRNIHKKLLFGDDVTLVEYSDEK